MSADKTQARHRLSDRPAIVHRNAKHDGEGSRRRGAALTSGRGNVRGEEPPPKVLADNHEVGLGVTARRKARSDCNLGGRRAARRHRLRRSEVQPSENAGLEARGHPATSLLNRRGLETSALSQFAAKSNTGESSMVSRRQIPTSPGATSSTSSIKAL